jgi:hypothetical protein
VYIDLPPTLTKLGGLKNCPSLKIINIPASVTIMEEDTFSFSFDIEEINVDPENEYYTSHIGVLYDKAMETLLYYPASKKDVSYTAPETIKKIVYYAFFRQGYLENIILPEGFLEIDQAAFAEASKLKYVYLPDSLEKIGIRAFVNCVSLEQVHISGSVLEIGDSAFLNCSKLTLIWR